MFSSNNDHNSVDASARLTVEYVDANNNQVTTTTTTLTTVAAATTTVNSGMGSKMKKRFKLSKKVKSSLKNKVKFNSE